MHPYLSLPPLARETSRSEYQAGVPIILDTIIAENASGALALGSPDHNQQNRHWLYRQRPLHIISRRRTPEDLMLAAVIITLPTFPGRQKAGVKFTVVPPERRDLAAIIDATGLLQEPARIGRDLRLQIDHRAVFP